MNGTNSRRSPPANDAFQDAKGTPSQAWQNFHQDVANAAFAAAPNTNPVITGTTTIDGINGTEKLLKFTTAGVLRWDFGVAGNGEAANGGSDLILRRYADDGSLASVELTISRLSGQWQFTAPVAFTQAVTFNRALAPLVTGANTAALLNSLIAGLTASGLVRTSRWVSSCALPRISTCYRCCWT